MRHLVRLGPNLTLTLTLTKQLRCAAGASQRETVARGSGAEAPLGGPAEAPPNLTLTLTMT